MEFSRSVGLLVAMVIVLLGLVSTAMIPESELKGSRETERIIGGKDAELGQFPWAVALSYDNRFLCTASIISENTVMTAAHCVVSDGAELSSSLFHGIAHVDKRSESVRIDFREIIVHPQYEFPNNDIAIMKTTKPIPFDNNVQPICIARPDTPMNEYSIATAMGWGDTWRLRIISSIPDILQYVDQRIVPNSRCSSPITSDVDENKICARGFLTGVCNGDSGGPLVHFIDGEIPVEIGITSYGSAIAGCGTPSPAVFTRVSEYYDFIMQASGNDTVCTA